MNRFSRAAVLVVLGLAACDQPTAPGKLSTLAPPKGQAGDVVVSNAVYTIVNDSADGPGTCFNGPVDNIQNCNIYAAKQNVWLGGEAVHGSGPNSLPNGTYFFAVLQPGGQQDPNDGGGNVLSDPAPTTNTGAGDSYANRTFTLANGVIGYTGTHSFGSNKIRLFPFDDTPNAGGEYIMAVCSLANGYPVNPSDCKYDAFKVKVADAPVCTADCTPVAPEAAPLTASKTDAAEYTNTYAWGIAKTVDRTVVKQVGGTATFNYTVTVTHDAGTINGVKVTGTISVSNPNAAPVQLAAISDQLSDGTVCTVSNAATQIAAQSSASFAYQCSLSALPATPLDNSATASWTEQSLSDGSHLAAGSANASATGIAFAENVVDGSVNLTDSFAGSLGALDRTSASPMTYTYARTIGVAANVCNTYGNVASYLAASGTTGSASQSVMVCGNVAGGLTIGFWQNKNGQAIISGGASTSGVCNSGAYLRTYAPFRDVSATATCAQVASYATAIIKAASASSAAMNAMLKAQMLATTLDVYFSTASLGGNKILAPAALGGIRVDLAMVCSSIGSCSSTYRDVSAAFGGSGALTVGQIISFAATQSNDGGSSWYGQSKATQELAKNTFDAINNAVALVAP